VTNAGSIDAPEFSLTPFTTETLASRSLPVSDLRYSKTQFKPGTRIEISAEAVQLTHSITSLVVNGAREFPTPSPTPQMSSSIEPNPKPSGSGTALFIDYGPLDGIPSESLRGIHEHKFTSPFERPGMQDLTADVDFGCIKDTALSVPGARVSGPTPQGDFLLNMGLEFRAQRLIQTGKVTEDKREAIIKEVQRLAGKEKGQMGAAYNVMAITSRKTTSKFCQSERYPWRY
jgi:NADH dehydrogenase [ubiquinone] 1 alpha subcomplex assembly factor 7